MFCFVVQNKLISGSINRERNRSVKTALTYFFFISITCQWSGKGNVFSCVCLSVIMSVHRVNSRHLF